MLRDVKIKKYPQKAIIYQQGDFIDGFYFIKNGEVEILKLV